MNMKKLFGIDGEEFEIEAEKREVTIVKIRKNRKILSAGTSIRNPKDAPNEALGERIALGRALKSFFQEYYSEYQTAAHQKAIVRAFQEYRKAEREAEEKDKAERTEYARVGKMVERAYRAEFGSQSSQDASEASQVPQTTSEVDGLHSKVAGSWYEYLKALAESQRELEKKISASPAEFIQNYDPHSNPYFKGE